MLPSNISLDPALHVHDHPIYYQTAVDNPDIIIFFMYVFSPSNAQLSDAHFVAAARLTLNCFKHLGGLRNLHLRMIKMFQITIKWNLKVSAIFISYICQVFQIHVGLQCDASTVKLNRRFSSWTLEKFLGYILISLFWPKPWDLFYFFNIFF